MIYYMPLLFKMQSLYNKKIPSVYACGIFSYQFGLDEVA